MGKNFLTRFAVIASCTFILQIALFLFQPADAHAAVDPRPNIIVIETDDMGWGDLCANNPNSMACQRYTFFICDTSDAAAECTIDSECTTTSTPGCKERKSNTPRLDSLASGGMTLTNFYTPSPLCTPSRGALMTGRDPRRAGTTDAVSNTIYLKEAETTLAEVLFDAGYNTAIIGKWNLSWGTDTTTGKENNSWNQGFEYNYMLPVGVHYGHKGFCLAKKFVDYSNNKIMSATTWHYIDKVLDYSGVNISLPDQYKIIDAKDHKYDIIIDACNPANYNFSNDDPDGAYSKYIGADGVTKLFVWNGFWNFSKVSSSTTLKEEISLEKVLTNRAKEYIANTEFATTHKVRDIAKPFFLYLGYLAPHTPMRIHLPSNQDSAIKNKCEQLPSSKGGCSDKNQDIKTYSLCVANCEIDMGTVYTDVIHEIDTNVGQILKMLDETEDPRNSDPTTKKYLKDNTIVIFMSDNGPFMSDDNAFWQLRSGSTGGLRGGKKFTYEGGVRVPFIARWPGKWPAPKNANISSQIVDMRDIFPTLIKAAFVNAGLCDTSCQCTNTNNAYCVQNGLYASSATTIKYGENISNPTGYVDGKDISAVLSTGDIAADNKKNMQISWFGNFQLCVSWDNTGACSAIEDSHPFAIRSNVANTYTDTATGEPVKVPTVPAGTDVGEYKLYFTRDDNYNVRMPVELYSLKSNNAEAESNATNLCFDQSTNQCSLCGVTITYNLDGTRTGAINCPTWAYKSVAETLWKRAFQYQENARANKFIVP